MIFFCINIHNIINFQIESNIMWKSEYFDSENFAWNDDHEHKKTVNLYMIDQLNWSNLINAKLLFNSSYQLQLQLNSMTASALKHILDNSSLKDIEIFRSSLLNCSIIFSSKVINFKKNAFNFDFKDFFSFFLMRKKLICKVFW